MEVEIEQIGKTLLDAPVGHVEQTISHMINKPVYLKVVEQNSVAGTKYVRKVIIGYSQFPILRAIVKFDSVNIPKSVMTALLQKKESIGKILQKNKIVAQRRITALDFEPDRKTINREYEILYDDSVWFQISEAIRLDFLCACKYS
jgi:chorismate-pyruvate lyase